MRKRRAQTPVHGWQYAPLDITYTRAHAYAYIPLGPPNNYSLYIRFMHLRALTDYFNEGNFSQAKYRGEKGRGEGSEGMLNKHHVRRISYSEHVVHSRDIDRNERTNHDARLRPIIMRSHANQPGIPTSSASIAVYTASAI